MPGGYAASDSAATLPTASANGMTSCGPKKASRGGSSSEPQGGGGVNGRLGGSCSAPSVSTA